MDDIKILSKIKLKKNSHVPICKQLEAQLQALIMTYPHNTRLPSERKISTFLKIDRGTVQHALISFIKSGKIIRNGSKGTFINKLHENEIKVMGNIPYAHPMSLDNLTFNIATQITSKKLSLLIYENLPFQKDFWNSLVDIFNKQNYEFSVNIEWMPGNITNDYFEDYLHTRKPDIFQTFLTPVRIPLLAEIPESTYLKLTSNEYLHEHFWNLKYTFFRKIVPMYFSAPCIFWNRKLASKVGINDPYKSIKEKGILYVFKKTASERPDLIKSEDLWNYIMLSGIPICTSLSMKDVILKKFIEVLDVGNMCDISKDKHDDITADFLSEKKIFHLGQPLGIYARSQNYSFEPECAFIRLQKDFFNHSGTVGLGVYHESVNKDNAFKFLDFCISKEANNLLVEKLHAISFYKKANEKYLEIFPRLNRKELADVIKSVKSFYHNQTLLINPFSQESYKIFNELLLHNISLDDAVEATYITYDTYCQKYTYPNENYSNPWLKYLEK